jgi:hypothetical protein
MVALEKHRFGTAFSLRTAAWGEESSIANSSVSIDGAVHRVSHVMHGKPTPQDPASLPRNSRLFA